LTYYAAMRCPCTVALVVILAACGSSGQGSTGTDGGNDGTGSGGMPGDGLAPSDDGGLSDALMDVNAPSIDPSTPFVNLSSSQLAQICDWQEALLGGYGAVIPCTSGNTDNFADQAQCVEALTFSPGGCTMTVGEYETCVLARAPSKGCDYPEPQCTKYFLCHTIKG
jgi:hypothetical protein